MSARQHHICAKAGGTRKVPDPSAADHPPSAVIEDIGTEDPLGVNRSLAAAR
jgi:hypothetical protein